MKFGMDEIKRRQVASGAMKFGMDEIKRRQVAYCGGNPRLVARSARDLYDSSLSVDSHLLLLTTGGGEATLVPLGEVLNKKTEEGC